jgi:hypothetical protein
MSEKFVETPIEPHSSRRDIADRINRAFSTSDITAICQRLRGVQPSVASSDESLARLLTASSDSGGIDLDQAPPTPWATQRYAARYLSVHLVNVAGACEEPF